MKSTPTLLILGLALSATQGLHAADLFDRVPPTYDVGEGPYDVFGADFDGDGDLDLAVVNQYADSGNHCYVTVVLNDGDGTYAEREQYGTGLGPMSLSGADFDGDGDIDLVCVSPQLTGNKNIFLLSNEGDGTFASGPRYYSDGNPRFVTTADTNGDGDFDLVIAATSRDSLAFLSNNGDGTFGAVGLYPLGTDTNPRSACPCDLDGDGDLDLAVANSGTEATSLLLNSGTGIFTRRSHELGAPQAAVTGADLDGDGDTDLAFAHWKDGVSVILNGGDGTFEDSQYYPAAGQPGSIQAADFDGDGDLDLAVANTYTPYKLYLLPNNGDGTFAAPIDYDNNGKRGALFAGDLDDDGTVDLAVTRYSRETDGLSILLNRGDGTFAGLLLHSMGNIMASFVGDLDGDGASDDLATVDYSAGNDTVFLNNGSVLLSALHPLDAEDPTLYVSGADFDNDSDIDLVVTASSAVSFSVYPNNGDGTFGAGIASPAGSNPRYLCPADFDGDGDIDLAIGASSFPSGVSRILNNGDGTFESLLMIHEGGAIGELWCADFDGDGDSDVAAIEWGLVDGVLILLNHGDATFAESVSYTTADSDTTGIFGHDFDGDGDCDLAVSNGDTAILFNQGDGTFESPVHYEAIGGLLTGADLNGDGHLDLIGTHGQTDPYMTLVGVLLGVGDGTFAQVDHYPTARGGSVRACVDFDGDGDLDVAVGNQGLTIHYNQTIGEDVRRIECVLRAGVLHLQFTGLADRTYVIQRTPALFPEAWSDLTTPLGPDVSGFITFEDTESPLASEAFYRVVETGAP